MTYEKFQTYQITAPVRSNGKQVKAQIQAVFAKEDDRYFYFVSVSSGKEVKLAKQTSSIE
jgi:uncharacterized protein YqfB (UPF0267 family)